MQISPSLNYANTIATFNPLGKNPVGQEAVVDSPTTFVPVEQSAQLARRENQRDPSERVNNGDERDRLAADAKAESEKTVQAEQEAKDQVVIAELSARDREVRAHEAAHAAVGGQYASAPSYTFERGPDGVSYAVGGEVSISTSAIPNDPEATIAKAQIIKAAANAPSEPSGQDRQVAAQAAQLEQQARADLVALQVAERTEKVELEEQERLAREEELERQRKADESSGSVDGLQNTGSVERADENSDLNDEIARRQIDLSQKLIDIGVNTPNIEPPGTYLDQIA